MAHRKRQTKQTRSQRTNGRPMKSFGVSGQRVPQRTYRTSMNTPIRAQLNGRMGGCPKGTHPMPGGVCMEGAYHGAPTNGGQQTYDITGFMCHEHDGGGWSSDVSDNMSELIQACDGEHEWF